MLRPPSIATVFSAVALLLSAAADAAPIPVTAVPTFAGTLPLPFAVELGDVQERFLQQRTWQARQGVVAEGPLAGRPWRLEVAHLRDFTPEEGGYAGFVDRIAAVVEQSGEAQHVETLRLGGHAFRLLDYRPADTPVSAPREGEDPASVPRRVPKGPGLDRSIELLGVVNGGLLSIVLSVPDDAQSREDWRRSMADFDFDERRIDRSARVLEDLDARAIDGPRVDMPIGSVEVDASLHRSFIDESTVRGPTGETRGRSRVLRVNSLSLGMHSLILRMACDRADSLSPEDREVLATWPRFFSELKESKDVGALRLGGVDGKLRTALYGDSTEPTSAWFWHGTRDGVLHRVEIHRLRADEWQATLLENLGRLEFGCTLDD